MPWHPQAGRALTSIGWRLSSAARGARSGRRCAAKYSAARLEELLAGFAPGAPENLLVGLDPADDAAVQAGRGARAHLHHRLLPRPWWTTLRSSAAVAAANALNDVFAMGGRPLLALSIAAFPEEPPVETVRSIFDAAAAKVHEAGAVLAGGHTIRDAEPKYGLAVVGIAHPDLLWAEVGRATGGRPLPDEAARHRARADGSRQGSPGRGGGCGGGQPHDRAERPRGRRRGASSPERVTDVTGFGLFGHAREVAERSGVRVLLDADALPALPGALAGRRRRSAPAVMRATGLRRTLGRPRWDFSGGSRGARLRPADCRRPRRLPPGREGRCSRGALPCRGPFSGAGRGASRRGSGVAVS